MVLSALKQSISITTVMFYSNKDLFKSTIIIKGILSHVSEILNEVLCSCQTQSWWSNAKKRERDIQIVFHKKDTSPYTNIQWKPTNTILVIVAKISN